MWIWVDVFATGPHLFLFPLATFGAICRDTLVLAQDVYGPSAFTFDLLHSAQKVELHLIGRFCVCSI